MEEEEDEEEEEEEKSGHYYKYSFQRFLNLNFQAGILK
jgi:hypothetical protein